MVAVCGSYLFACGKTSNMQLSQNNLSLQAIWLEVNWSMTDPIYSVSHWFNFLFFVVFDIHVIVLVSLLNRLFAFILHSEYTTSCFMAKTVVLHNFQSSSIRQIFHWFALNSNFIQPYVCKYVLFVCFLCLPDCKYLLFPCVSNTLAGDFLSTQLIYRGKVELCHPCIIFAEKNRNYFSRTLSTAKIKIREK